MLEGKMCLLIMIYEVSFFKCLKCPYLLILSFFEFLCLLPRKSPKETVSIEELLWILDIACGAEV